MKNLLKNRLILSSCFSILAFGCTNSSYKVLNQDGYRTELLISPDRVILQCEDVQVPREPLDPDGRYGLMLYVLDEENTVLTFSQGQVLGKKDCFGRIEKIGKIIRNGKQIYRGGMES